jgi:hypothetical protein
MHFFFRLIPPRTTFAQDITPSEAQLMQAHALYWRQLMDKGHVAAFGLVADPGGAYGIGVVEMADAEQAAACAANDPTIKADVGFRYEVHPMPRAVVRA